jgi:hypothetical protein
MNVTIGTTRLWAVLAWFCLLTAGFPDRSTGQEPGRDDVAPQWLTGKELDQSSRLAVSGDFNGGSLRQSLQELARRRKTAIFLDRRVDPDLALNLSLIDLTFEQLLWKVADWCGLGVCRIGDVYYLGPENTAFVLPVLLDELKSKSSSRKNRGDGPDWRVKDELAWPELSEPRQLVEQLAQHNQFNIINAQVMPHDLWPAVSLPELALEERLALLLVGFELWFEQTAPGEIKLIPFPASDRGTRVITNVSEPGRASRELREEFSNCKFTARGKSLVITGPVESIGRAVSRLVERQQVERGDPTLSRFSLDTTASRGGILNTIVRQMGLQLEIAPELQQMLDERVTIKISQQPIEVIVAEVLKGTSARFEFNGGQLKIFLNDK